MSGVLYHNPSEIVADLMCDLGLAAFADAVENLTGWTVFAIHWPESPDQAILVSDTAGRLHRRVHVTGVMGEHYGIQVLVRSAEDPATPYVKTKRILEFFDTQVRRETVVLEDSDGIDRTYRVNAINRVGPAVPAGRDGRRFVYSGNAIASIELVEAETGTGS